MAHQTDPNMQSLNWRCPLQYAAKVKTRAENEKITVSALVCKVMCKAVEDVKPSESAKKWAKERLEANKKIRAKQDELTRSGYFRKGK